MEMTHRFSAFLAKSIVILSCFLLVAIASQRTNKKIDSTRKRRIGIEIGGFPGEFDNRRQSIDDDDGDVYEFHRFQHYGFKTPAPNTFSLESMLALLAPLATIPIIASAALSSLASFLPSLTTEGMVKGRSRREALMNALDPSHNISVLEEASESLKHHFKRDVRDLDIIQTYLRKMNPKEDYNDEVMASYLQCSGMLSSNNHCLERLVCQFSDDSSTMPSLEKDVSSLIIYTILNNKHIREDFKDRLRKAAFFGRDSRGHCGRFFCSRKDFIA